MHFGEGLLFSITANNLLAPSGGQICTYDCKCACLFDNSEFFAVFMAAIICHTCQS